MKIFIFFIVILHYSTFVWKEQIFVIICALFPLYLEQQ